MLKKVMKYDCQAVFRLWWIAAAVTFALAILGGFAQIITNNDAKVPEMIDTTAGMIIFFAYFCMFGLVLLSEVLMFMRFYRNFFTDEGYLTFTLPVKREVLFNSKILTGLAVIAASGGVCIVSNFTMFLISHFDLFTTGEYFKTIADFFDSIPKDFIGYLIVYALEALVGLALLLLLSVLFLYACITYGSMIAKKAKLLSSIGIYIAANAIFSFGTQLLLIFGIASIVVWTEPMSEQLLPKFVGLLLLAGILFLAILCALIYACTHWMLDRKLNLS